MKRGAQAAWLAGAGTGAPVAWLAGAPVALLAGACTPPPFTCDIAHERCDRNVYATVLRQRGDGHDPFAGLPPIEHITPEEFRARLASERAPDAAPTPWETALRLLGLLPPRTPPAEAAIDETVDMTAAYYTHATNRVTIIVRPSEDRAEDMSVLAHEFVHAIQDGQVDLEAPAMTYDERLARTTVIEGDAVLYQNLAYAEMKGYDVDLLDWRGFFGRGERAVREGVAASDAPFFAVRSMVYPLGGRYLHERFAKGGNGDVRRAYAGAPRETIGYLVDTPRTKGALCVPTPPAGFREHGADEMGAFVAYAFLTNVRASEESAYQLATTWRDDAIRVFTDDAGRVAVGYWLGIDADERLVDDGRAGLRVAVRAGGVLVAAATDAEVLAAWSLSCAGGASGGAALTASSALAFPHPPPGTSSTPGPLPAGPTRRGEAD